MTKPDEAPLDVSIRLPTVTVRASLEPAKLNRLLEDLKASEDGWHNLEDDGTTYHFRCRDVVCVEVRAARSSGYERLVGFTAADLARVTDVTHRTAARALQRLKDAGEIEMSSERRVAISEENFAKLNLTDGQRKALLRLAELRRDGKGAGQAVSSPRRLRRKHQS